MEENKKYKFRIYEIDGEDTIEHGEQEMTLKDARKYAATSGYHIQINIEEE